MGISIMEVVVQVMNYGDSIPEEDLPYLFDMFYTGDKSRSENRGGTGLGLFIAKILLNSIMVRFLLKVM